MDTLVLRLSDGVTEKPASTSLPYCMQDEEERSTRHATLGSYSVIVIRTCRAYCVHRNTNNGCCINANMRIQDSGLRGIVPSRLTSHRAMYLEPRFSRVDLELPVDEGIRVASDLGASVG